jgi:hypothetical protein
VSKATIKTWFTWYDHPGVEPASFDTEGEALGWQADPKGTPGLGRKWVMRVVFTPPSMAKRADDMDLRTVWTNDAPKQYPGPETEAETLERLRLAGIERGVALIVNTKSDEKRDQNRNKLLAEHPELDELTVRRMEKELRALRDSRKRGPREREARPHA